jgi:hypothetical protein
MMAQISQAKSIDKFAYADVKLMMSNAAGSGLSMEGLYETIAKQKHITKAAAAAMISNGTMKADDGIKALLDTIERTVSGGKIGSVSLESGTSLAGQASTIASLPNRMWQNLNIDSAGVQGIKAFEDAIIKTFAHVFGEGGKGNVLLQKWVDKIGTLLGSVDPDKMGAFFDRIIVGIEGVTAAANAFWVAFKPALDSFKANGGLFAEGGSFDPKKWERIAGYIGTAANAVARLVDLMARFAAYSSGATAISWLMEKFGDAPPAAKSVSPNNPKVGTGIEDAASGMSIQVTAPITVNSSGGDGEAVARTLSEQLPQQLDTSMRRMAIERGSIGNKL